MAQNNKLKHVEYPHDLEAIALSFFLAAWGFHQTFKDKQIGNKFPYSPSTSSTDPNPSLAGNSSIKIWEESSCYIYQHHIICISEPWVDDKILDEGYWNRDRAKPVISSFPSLTTALIYTFFQHIPNAFVISRVYFPCLSTPNSQFPAFLSLLFVMILICQSSPRPTTTPRWLLPPFVPLCALVYPHQKLLKPHSWSNPLNLACALLSPVASPHVASVFQFDTQIIPIYSYIVCKPASLIQYLIWNLDLNISPILKVFLSDFFKKLINVSPSLFVLFLTKASKAVESFFHL